VRARQLGQRQRQPLQVLDFAPLPPQTLNRPTHLPTTNSVVAYSAVAALVPAPARRFSGGAQPRTRTLLAGVPLAVEVGVPTPSRNLGIELSDKSWAVVAAPTMAHFSISIGLALVSTTRKSMGASSAAVAVRHPVRILSRLQPSQQMSAEAGSPMVAAASLWARRFCKLQPLMPTLAEAA